MLLFGCFWLIIHHVCAQDQRIADSLAGIYNKHTLEGRAELELLRQLSFNEMRDSNKALTYAEELIRLSEQAGDDDYLRRGYYLKGTKKRLLGNLVEAHEAFFKSAEIAGKSNQLIGEGQAYGAIADIYSVTDDHPNAMRYYNKAIVALRRSDDSIGLASFLSNAGDEYLKTRNYDSALLYSLEAKMLFDKLDYASGKGYCLGNIGMVYANTGRHTLAEGNLNEAIRILEEVQDYYPICVYLISLADVYLNKADSLTALKYIRRSLRLAEQYGLKEQIAEASLKLSEFYERTGNTSAAFEQYKKHVAYRDSVNNIKTVQKIARIENDQIRNEVDTAIREKRDQQIIIIALFIILGLTILLLGTLYWFYKSKSKEKARLHQQELLHARLEIQEQTYRDISQELHDNIGQALSLVKININTIDVNNSDLAREKLTESKELLTKAIQDLRDISKTLHTDFINEIGLADAVDQQLQLLKRTGLYTTQLSVKGDPYPYGPGRDLLVYRVVQELLNNIVKHAGADQIVVSMIYETEKMVISVGDNGKGFDRQTQQSSSRKGLGLRNIHNRLKLIKGSVFFESEPGKGTTATVEILK